MTTETRLEADSIGTMEVPAEAYYGVQALRAKQNFPITGTKLHPVFIRNLAQIKKAAAITNNNAGLLPEDKADAIVRACDEVIAGKLAEEFIVDAIQGGAGTSANMNMNEVIANRAGEILGCPKGSYKMVHPNDHVNMAQSTNDVIPTAGKLTVLDLLAPLEKALIRLEKELAKKAEESGMCEADYLRLLISQKPNDYPEVRKLLKELINEVNRIGININQIVFNNNAGLYSKEDKTQLVAYMRKLNKKVNEAVVQIGNQ